MIVLLYQKRFAPPIRAGIKRQTIRPERKRPILVGDELSHRMWEGVAYRSNQVEIAKGKCTAVVPITVEVEGVIIGKAPSLLLIDSPDGLNEFAVGDGFSDWADMLAYFNEPDGYSLPFTGTLIQWE